MVFSSLLFLFRFLPAVLILYYLAPKKYKNLVLFIVSLIFYGWDEPLYILLMLFSTVLDYSVGMSVRRSRSIGKEGRAKIALLCSVIINLGLLGFFKYSDFVINTINSIFSASIPNLNLTLPIGISFYTFQTLSYSIDVYRKRVDTQTDIISFGAYISMFPQLIAGPIVQYKTIENQLNNKDLSIDSFSYGVKRFSQGLAKKVIVANTVGELFSEISCRTSGLSTATAWLGVFAFTLQIYFDFSGYSDMAIGLGKMLGFSFLENFDYPYESKSITEFWRRWHISLGSFFREYLYIPLGGNRKGKSRQVLNLLIVWALTGLWHGASWNFVLWGLYYFVFLVIEKLFLKRFLDKAPALISHIYTIIVFIVGWAIFAYPDFADGNYYIRSLISSDSFIDNDFVYFLLNYLPVILIGILFSTSFPKKLFKTIKARNKTIAFIIEISFVVFSFAFSVMFLVSDSYNPFLYFRF